jgi:hypothetical protein
LQVGKKFIKCDEDKDGMINKTQFGNIIKELDLKLTPLMLKQYVDVNFKFVDRTLQGKISFGQFLACYANFLYTYEISQVSSGTALSLDIGQAVSDALEMQCSAYHRQIHRPLAIPACHSHTLHL